MTALRGRDYRNLLAAGLVSETGDWLLLVALPILVFEVTGSTLGTFTEPTRNELVVAAASLSRRRDDPRRGRRGPPDESGSGGFEPNPLGGSGGMQPPSVNPGNTGKT